MRAPGKPLLLGIIALCTLIEAACLLTEIVPFGSWNLRNLLLGYGAFWPDLLHGSQPVYAFQPALMFVTYGFLHGGLLHLVFNMMTLWMLGRVVIARSSALHFSVIYLLSLLGGGACYGLLHSESWPMVGASGALFGLAGAIVLWIWRAQPALSASLAATWKIFAFLLLYNVVMYFALAGGLAWEAHLGGFLAGWVVAWIWPRRGPKGGSRSV